MTLDGLCQLLFETREDWLTGADFVLDYRKLAKAVLELDLSGSEVS